VGGDLPNSTTIPVVIISIVKQLIKRPLRKGKQRSSMFAGNVDNYCEKSHLFLFLYIIKVDIFELHIFRIMRLF